MKYKFKVGDKFIVNEYKELCVVSLTTWHGVLAYRTTTNNGGPEIWLETELDPFVLKKVDTTPSVKQFSTKTMWALVLKSAPKVINHIDDLFMTRAEARKEKSKEDLTAYKVVKVNLTWED